MTRVREPGQWIDGTPVPGAEFEALDEGQHTAIKYGPGAVYEITGNPLTLTNKGLRLAGDGLKLDSADGATYSGGVGGAPLRREFVMLPMWNLTLSPSTVWALASNTAQQLANTTESVAHALDLAQWHKQKLRRLRVHVKGGFGHTDGNIGTMVKPKFAFVKQKIVSSDLDEVLGLDQFPFTYYSDDSTTATAYENLHWIDTGEDALNETIDVTQYRYVMFLQGESGTGSINPSQFVAIGVCATIDISTKPFG